MKLLLVEDDRFLGSSLQARLAEFGYVVDRVRTCDEAATAARLSNYTLIILDRRLPDGDAIGSIAALRRAQSDVRIIVLSALDATTDKIDGLDAGADDYLTKPFDFDELIARVRAALRRPGAAPQPPIRCGRLRYDPQSREFTIGSEPILLKRRELLILEALIMRARRVVQRDVFMDQVYGFNESIQSNTLDAHISRLRGRLGELDAQVQIHPVRGVGYMLAEVSPP